jgi:RimJ/RimL family protein N-acetyltransferase
MNQVEELGENWDERIAELLCLLNPDLDPNPQTAMRWIREERRRGRRYFGIVEGDRILSVASVAPFEGKCWKVGVIYTVPERRGRGLATSVLSRAVQEAFNAGAEKVVAFVQEGNTAAMRVFQKAGFEVEEVKGGIAKVGRSARE